MLPYLHSLSYHVNTIERKLIKDNQLRSERYSSDIINKVIWKIYLLVASAIVHSVSFFIFFRYRLDSIARKHIDKNNLYSDRYLCDAACERKAISNKFYWQQKRELMQYNLVNASITNSDFKIIFWFFWSSFCILLKVKDKNISFFQQFEFVRWDKCRQQLLHYSFR